MANGKEPTKLYKVRNGYTVMRGNQAIKEGVVELTEKEYGVQSWKVEVAEEKEEATESHQLSDALADKEIKEKSVEESNIDRSVKRSRTFNRVMKTPKG